MPTRHSNRPSNREIKFPSSENPAAKESYISKSNMPLMKVSQLKERKLEEPTKPHAFNAKENQKKIEEKGTLRMKDANKTTLISSSICKTNQSVAIKASEGATHQRRAAKKPRGKYSQAKN
jgi:hypothetical protein